MDTRPKNLLHVYAQPNEHAEAYVVGTPTGLLRLRAAIDAALATGEASAGGSFTGDGEGFAVLVIPMPDADARWETLRLPYARWPDAELPPGEHPFALLGMTSYRSLWKQATAEQKEDP